MQLAEKRITKLNRQITDVAQPSEFKSKTLLQMTTPRKLDFHPLFKEDHFSKYNPAKTSDRNSDTVTNASVLSPKASQASMQARIMKAGHRKSRSVAFKYPSSMPKLQ